MASSNNSDGAAELAAVLTVMTITAFIITVQLITMEAVRIYRAHAFKGTVESQWLWWSLIGMFAADLVSIALASSPATAGYAIWPGSLGFLAWVIIIETVDAIGGGQQVEEDPQELSDVLGPWRLRRPAQEITNAAA